GSESIPEANIPLWKRARFTTPTGGYEVGESSVAATARQIRPALTIANRRRADDRLIGRLRRERGDTFAPCLPLMHRRFLTPVIIVLKSWTTASHERSTQVPPVTPAPTATTTIVTEAQIQALIDQGVATAMAEAEESRVRNGYGRVALTRWNSHVKTVTLEGAQALPWKTLKKMMTDKVEKYIGGVPDTIHDSVKAAKPKTMQEAIEFTTELMDKRIRDAIENKRKFKGTSGNNQYQPQQNKRQNTGRAY
nr:hypothetical protein [Tanacetum cinerariifolium]